MARHEGQTGGRGAGLVCDLWEDRMDFIERIFGIAPDGGSGSLEAMLFILPVAIATIVVVLRNRARIRRRNR